MVLTQMEKKAIKKGELLSDEMMNTYVVLRLMVVYVAMEGKLESLMFTVLMQYLN